MSWRRRVRRFFRGAIAFLVLILVALIDGWRAFGHRATGERRARMERSLAAKAAKLIVPLGVGAHLEYWGVPLAKIVEVDWWEHVDVGGLDVVCTPARHASGRFLTDKDATLWASYALIGKAHRVWYSGDTGLFPALSEIGAKWGPFDLTMIEVGQYHKAWPDWHIGPEQAVRAHVMVRGKALLPIHWGLLRLAYHGWTEPIERARAESTRRDVRAIFPRPGESIEPDAPKPTEPWWPKVPWKTGAEDPIVSGQLRLREEPVRSARRPRPRRRQACGRQAGRPRVRHRVAARPHALRLVSGLGRRRHDRDDCLLPLVEQGIARWGCSVRCVSGRGLSGRRPTTPRK